MKGKKWLYETWNTRAPFALKANINSAYNRKYCVFSCTALLLQPTIFYFKGRLEMLKAVLLMFLILVWPNWMVELGDKAASSMALVDTAELAQLTWPRTKERFLTNTRWASVTAEIKGKGQYWLCHWMYLWYWIFLLFLLSVICCFCESSDRSRLVIACHRMWRNKFHAVSWISCSLYPLVGHSAFRVAAHHFIWWLLDCSSWLFL